MKLLSRWLCIALLLPMLWGFSPSPVQAQATYRIKYRTGKELFKRKLYFDAIKEFHQAAQTPTGQRKFIIFYYLARSYYWLPDIQKAFQNLEKAKPLIKNKAQRTAYQGLVTRIKNLYGTMLLVPEVDPEEVGSKLVVELQAKSPFSNKHKQRYFRAVQRRLKTNGGLLLNNRPVYLPKGEYLIRIKQPQCLKYGLVQSDNLVQEFSVGDSETQIGLKEKRSCECKGGQKVYKERNRLYCSCPPGTGWDKKKKRCIVAKTSSPLPWILTAVGVAVVGGTVVTVLATRGDGSKRFHLAAPGTQDGANTLKVWK